MKILSRAIALILTLTLLITCAPSALAAKNKAYVTSKTYDMPYYIEVDIANQITTVYSTADNSIVRQMICTTGMGSLTPRGTYIMPANKYAQDRQEWYYFPEFKIYAKYASRVIGGILFHSILFSSRGSTNPTWASNHALGSKASHGCIRLRVPDAKWIAENCLPGTQVRMFDDGERNNDLRALLKISTFSVDEVSYEDFLGGAVMLSNGVKTDSVVVLQNSLNALGYDCGKADGYFGTKTEKAVLAFQHDYGYEETGIVSPKLLEEIKTAQPLVTPEPSATPAADEADDDTEENEVIEDTGITATVKTKTWLNVRSEPDVSATLLTTLKNGKKVTVIAQTEDWYQISIDNTVGYVSAAYLVLPKDAVVPTVAPTVEPTEEPDESEAVEPEATEEPEDAEEPDEAEDGSSDEEADEIEAESEETEIRIEAEVVKLSTWLNVRSDSKMAGKVLAKLHSGDKVQMIGTEGKWAKIELEDGTVGYVLSEYLIYDTEVFPEPEEFIPEGSPAITNNSDGVRLRREPNENGGIITTIADKTTIYVQEDMKNGWLKVYALGFTGYMSDEFVSGREEIIG